VIDTAEFRRALGRSRGYLLSHHLPSDHHRCYALPVGDRTVHLCARCSGIYPGILGGLLAYWLAPPLVTSLALVAVLPLPALLDWTVTAFTQRTGQNVVRTITGLFLGYAYGVGLPRLFLDGTILVLAIGFGYALLAGALLAGWRRRP
jgi:uncharacterized membrane protein